MEWKEKAREQRKEQRKNMSGERQQCSDLRSDLAYTLPLEASGKTTEDSLLKTIKRIEGSVKGIEAKMRDKHAAYAQSVLPQFIITLPCTDGVRPVAKNFLYEDFACVSVSSRTVFPPYAVVKLTPCVSLPYPHSIPRHY